jgi:hypothetical protein
LGLSGIANVVAAIKTAKRLELGDEDVLITVATDSAALYGSERRKFLAAQYPSGFDNVNAGEIFGQHLLGAADNDVLELTHDERSRIFNLGFSLGSNSRACCSPNSKGAVAKASGGGCGKPLRCGTISSPSSMSGRASEKIVDAGLRRALPPHQRARPQPAREGHVAQ